MTHLIWRMLRRLTLLTLAVPVVLAVLVGLVACGGGDSECVGATSGDFLPLQIRTQPQASAVHESEPAAFSVSVRGSKALKCQWFRDGLPIPGATAAVYRIPAAGLSDNGASFHLLLTDKAATLASQQATLSVHALPVHASAAQPLILSEVSHCNYQSSGCWFEIHNPASSTANLQNYRFKSSSVNTVAGEVLAQATYQFPAFEIPAGGYLVVSGNGAHELQRGTQNLRMVSPDQAVPSWGASGFVELLQTGRTVDFVRFGESPQSPVTPGEWNGNAVASLKTGPGHAGTSIARSYPAIGNANSNSAAEWVLVPWATPAGRNDVPPWATDADGDGVPHTAKQPGGTFAGLDLYAMGARPGQRDVFMHVSVMNSQDPGVTPRAEALQKLAAVFAAHGIHLHIDAGTLYSSHFAAEQFNLGQGSSTVPYEPCVKLTDHLCPNNASSRRSLYHWKNEFMDLRRSPLFHYALFANSQNPDGSGGSSGLAEYFGGDLIVSLGNWALAQTPGPQRNRLVNTQAATLMHELGHNLGLHHGGQDPLNSKPNYWSVMNYLYMVYGLDGQPAGMKAYDRWRSYILGEADAYSSFSNSPEGPPSQFIMDYSDGTSKPLNEARLFELDNVGRGSHANSYADWDGNHRLTVTPQAKDLNGDGARTLLNDYNDWAHLVMPFRRSASYTAADRLGKERSMPDAGFDAVLDDRQAFLPELAPVKRWGMR